MSPAEIVDEFFMSRQVFTHADVLALTPGLHPRNLQNWCSRELIDVDVLRPGRQGKREYLPRQLATIYVCHSLVEHGIELSRAAAWAEHAVDGAIHLAIGQGYRVIPGYSEPSEAKEADYRPLFTKDPRDIVSVLFKAGPDKNDFRMFTNRLTDKPDLLDVTAHISLVIRTGQLLFEVAEAAQDRKARRK